MPLSRTLALALAVLLANTGSVLAAGEGLCGRPPTPIPDLLIKMRDPGIEAMWRDKTMFMFKDTADETFLVFSIAKTSAHPAVACSRPVKGSATGEMETGMDCAAAEPVCTSFLETAMKNMNRIRSETK